MDYLKQSISERSRQRDIQRQMVNNHIRKAIFHPDGPIGKINSWLLPITKDLLGMLVGSLGVMYLLSWMVTYFSQDRDCIIDGVQYWTSKCHKDGVDYMRYYPGFDSFYMFAGLGIIYSIQATVYKYRMMKDPNYVPPKCKCGNKPTVNMKNVLNSKESSLFFGIPNSIFGVGFYALTTYLYWIHRDDIVTALLVVSCNFSLYLGWIMVHRIGSLCALCINIYAINILMLIKVTTGY
jgi:uncharacterized membrane protein